MSKRFIKCFNGEQIFSLEYDKETLRDMVLYKQEELEICVDEIERLRQENKNLNEMRRKLIRYIRGTTIIGMRYGKTLLTEYLNDMLKILEGSDKE